MRGAPAAMLRWARGLGTRGAAPAWSVERLNLDDDAVAADPFPHYEALRAGGAVRFLPRHDFWIVLGYEAVRTAFAEPEVFSNAPYADIDAVLLAADPPSHGAIRRVVSKRFSGSCLARLEAVARTEAEKLVQPAMEIVRGYGLAISRKVAAELIGFDDASVGRILDVADPGADGPRPLAALIEILDAEADRSDFHAQLIREDGGVVGDGEARSLVRLFWLAATITTERVITRSVLRLLQHETVHREVRANSDLRPALVEEVMRLHPPEHMLPRLATRDYRLDGVVIPAGSTVQLCVSAANRDPARFDAPTALRLDRASKGQLAFGGGIHHCLGAPLARRVAGAALDALLEASDRLVPLEPLDSVRYFKSSTALSPERLAVGL